MAAAVHDIQDILWVNGNPRGAIELTVIASSGPPIAQELAILIEDGDAVEPLIGDVHVFLAIQRDTRGPDQLPRAFSGLREVAHRLLIPRHWSNGELTHTGPQLGPIRGYILNLLPSPVDGIEGIALA